ncbi:MAG: AAA family ATPase [Candidatus Syntrophoarchaeum sp.]|nr:AAA family ATPase [Candidatus Syntrophoarchaeum sp.]
MVELEIEEFEEKERNVPPEIMRAIAHPGGFSLLIKGAPGTGKTSLALELLKKTGTKGIYLSTRVSPDSLYNHFPWLEDAIEPINIIDTGQIYVSSDLKVYSSAVSGMASFPERLAKRIEDLEANVTIVVDSWDAITEQEDVNKMKQLEALITELVREKEVNLILTSETLDVTYLDYMVDGVAWFNDVRVEGRRAREIEISKLRMTKLEQPKYPFTLDGGRFNCFMPFGLKQIPKSPSKIEPIPDTRTRISSGSKELDDVLNGGYKRGSFNVFEVSDDISSWGFEALVGFAIINAIAAGHPFVYVPCCGRTENHLKKRIIPFVDEEAYKKCVKVFEVLPEEGAVLGENTIGLTSGSVGEDIRTIREYTAGLESPVLSVLGIGSFEYPYRLADTGQVGEAIKELGRYVKSTKMRGNVDIVRVTDKLVLADELADMASTYIKLSSLDKTVVVCGIKPETELYNVDVEFTDGCPSLKITPFV